jgi:hypothetical protein
MDKIDVKLYSIFLTYHNYKSRADLEVGWSSG